MLGKFVNFMSIYWYFRKVGLLPFVLLPVLTVGCFPMGLPEYVAGLNTEVSNPITKTGSISQTTQSRIRSLLGSNKLGGKPVLLVLPGSGPARDSSVPGYDRQILGYQFVLGVVPMTRLYYEHGTDSLLAEAAIDAFVDAGYQPLIVYKDHATELPSLLRKIPAFELNLERISVYAYDALFFRILSVDGILNFSSAVESSNGDADAIPSKSVYIDDYQTNRHGHGPTLAYFLEKNLREAFSRGIREGVPAILGAWRQNRLRMPGADARVQPIVFLSLPRFQRRIDARIPQLLIDSYGYTALPPYSGSGVLRIIQRGLASGVLEYTNSLVVGPTGNSRGNKFGALGRPVWELRAGIEDLRLLDQDDAQYLSMRFKMTLWDNSSGSSAPLWRKTCRVEQKYADGVDGYWVVALERAAQRAAQAFFGNSIPEDSAASGLGLLNCREL